jgi:L-ribulokinase
MCGVVLGGIVAGEYGYEAGQSGVGDIFGHFVHTIAHDSHDRLTRLAAQQAVGEHGLIALDWHSGNRSVLVDHELSGLLIGETLSTQPEDVYRALLEATAFGARTIVGVQRHRGSGTRVRRRRRADEKPTVDADLL